MKKIITNLNKELNDYRDNIIKEHPESMLAALLTSMKEPQVLNTTTCNQARFIKIISIIKNIIGMELRLWMTVLSDAIFFTKVEKYFREVVSPAPDSIIKESDYLLLMARTAPEMYKFLLTGLPMNTSIQNIWARMRYLFICLKNIIPKDFSWLNEKQMTAISNRAYMLMSNLIGEQAANLEMVDSAGKPCHYMMLKQIISLFVFWDPTCGHCREEVPRLDSCIMPNGKGRCKNIWGAYRNKRTAKMEGIYK